jgi:hypothetical protein
MPWPSGWWTGSHPSCEENHLCKVSGKLVHVVSALLTLATGVEKKKTGAPFPAGKLRSFITPVLATDTTWDVVHWQCP